jgi:hypothetical protein
MTRRELKDAVVEAAREHTECKGGVPRMVKVDINLHRASHALDACTEPDLDALNAAVAEEADKCDWSLVQWPDLNPFIGAVRARRAAMKPKPRYAALEFGIRDHLKNITLTQNDVAALLNERKP